MPHRTSMEAAASLPRVRIGRPAVAALLFWACMAGAHAASIYKCVDVNGRLAYRDTPCNTHARQTKLDVEGLPLIDHGAPRFAASRMTAKPRDSAHRRRTGATAHLRKPPMSWECHAADGEVFYRHTRCPSSVRGDGVVRVNYARILSRGHPRRRHDAWSRVRVHGTRISRAEACRRIHSPAAAGRDGHLRDQTVSTYDHLMGRDPCRM